VTPAPADDLLARIGRGDADAADALFRAYTPYLRAIVRRQLADRLRGKLDSADVVQSVWVQVVRQLGRDGWAVANEDQLRGLLATIARRRLVTRVRQLTRGADREVPHDPDHPDPADPNVSRPSEEAQAADTWGRLLALCPPEHRPVLVLRRQGLSSDEIAARTGLHEGSVRRVLRQLARKLALADGAPAD
jgi:RNA polymerase sigma-70 factor (ECF subfamily)